jgi:uncharacterized NAD(P)/FAD-binding protein YdhS
VGALLAAEAAVQAPDRLRMARGDVLSLDRSDYPLRLRLSDGTEVTADLAVLAVGNFPPAPPPIADTSFYDTPSYAPDPWAPTAMAGLDPTTPVLLIGTGLTMVDVVISLLDQGHRGPIHAISRRGLLPRRHPSGPVGTPFNAGPYPTTARGLMRQLRQAVARTEANGGTWHGVIDALRPFTQDIWQAMPVAERSRFLRHARAWWDVLRHRMAGAVADRLDAARQSGQLRILRGRTVGYRVDRSSDPPVTATIRARGADVLAELRVGRVINCTGVFADFARVPHPLVRQLLDDGVARPDPLRLGLDVTKNGALLNRQGAISRRIFAVGPPTKGAFWEITAVPDIRRQCEVLAWHLAGLVPPAPAR